MAKPPRNPSMHDVAARAGVSHQTVSRVLNDFPGIRATTRERVLEAIEELGYRRNLAARALATGRSHTIGMIGPEVPDIGPLSTLHAIERSARAAGFHTLLTSADPSVAQVTDALDFLLGRNIDALALVAQHAGVHEALERVALEVPVVHLLTGGEPAGASASIDQRHGVVLAMDHLYSLGHRRIQHVSGPLSYYEAQRRRDAYLEFVRDHDLVEFDVIEGDWTADSGYAAGARLDPRATAVFCGNDQMALGLIHALAEQGRSVPDDISLVGFDDTSEARHSLPPVTTVKQDFAAVGQRAVDLLVAQLDGQDDAAAEPVQPTLVVRSSTRVAPPTSQ